MQNVGLHGSNQQIPNTPFMDRSNISSSLPRTLPPGFIPLNKDMHRLDTYVRPPTEQEWVIYHARVQNQKLCTYPSYKHLCIIRTLTMYPCLQVTASTCSASALRPAAPSTTASLSPSLDTC
jgi:hypothetical protein